MKLNNFAPISIKICYQGRRTKTREYEKYIDDLRLRLPDIYIPEEAPLFGFYQFGVSTYMQSRLEDLVSPVNEVLGMRYGLKPERFCTLLTDKMKVDPGEEFIRLYICSADDPKLLEFLVKIATRSGQMMISKQSE